MRWPPRSPSNSSTASSPTSTGPTSATSTPTPTTAWATTTTPRTSPPRRSSRPTGTSSAPSASRSGRPLRPWLIRIAHNLAANHFRDRTRKPQTNLDDTTVLSAIHTTEDLVEGRDELKRILEGVQQLPGDRREALIMRFALGMDNREIARALGRTDGATKVLIHRAIKQLEEIVDASSSHDRGHRLRSPAAPRAHADRAAERPVRARSRRGSSASPTPPWTSSSPGSSRRSPTRATGRRIAYAGGVVVAGAGAGAALVLLKARTQGQAAEPGPPGAARADPAARARA